jgi:hypothetical protein
MNVVIAGGRNFSDYKLLCEEVDKSLALYTPEELGEVVIVSGTANGADKLGERYALEHNLSVIQKPADWTQGKQAGYMRNAEMADIADLVICFWDGESKGTKHMIDLALKKQVRLVTVRYKDPVLERSKLADRLNKAKVPIEAAYATHNYELMGKCAKNYRDLYAECYGLWHENNFKDDPVFALAEYLRYLTLYCFHECFNYDGASNSFAILCRENAKKAGIKSVV